MAHAHMLQSWITLQGAANVVILMPQSRYLRVGNDRDVVAHVEVAWFTGTPNLRIQTCPSRETVDFVELDPTAAITLAVGVTNVALSSATVVTPAAHWIRWRLAGGGAAFGATFRVWLSLTS